MTEALYREDSYLKTCTTTITAVEEDGVEVEASVFYANGGGQPGDIGWLTTPAGERLQVTNTVKTKYRESQRHLFREPFELSVGDKVELEIDWDHRYRLMRYHSACHLLCAAVNLPVNGGSIQPDRARLDFNCPDGLNKLEVEEALNKLIQTDAPMSTQWISSEELLARPELVRTMAVKPPPTATGQIRLVEFKGVDLQACGGTHVASTSEIGPISVTKVENKGKQNRRVTIVFKQD